MGRYKVPLKTQQRTALHKLGMGLHHLSEINKKLPINEHKQALLV